MASFKISEDLRPLTDLKTRPGDVVTHAEETGRPVVLTRYGKGVAVLLSVEAYEELELAAARLKLFGALKEAHESFERGEGVPHSEVKDLVRSWRKGKDSKATV